MDLKTKKFAMTISYGNFKTGMAGTDKFLLTQEKVFQQSDVSFIHVYPYDINHVNRLFHNAIWRVSFDGERTIVADNQRIIRLIGSLCQKGYTFCGTIIHHLLRSDVKVLGELLDLIEGPVWFYFHDYFTICPQSGLFSQEKGYCGSSFPNDEKCAGCTGYCPKVQNRAEEIKNFLLKIQKRTTFITPSVVARDIVQKAYPELQDKIKVIPHQMECGTYGDNLEPLSDSAPIRVAYVGYQSVHKGWNEWKTMVTALANNKAFEFFHFGSCYERLDNVHEVSVDYKKSPTAMTDALRQYRIDVAVLWSLVPETYSYTYYEALSANCFIITSGFSGNIAAQTLNRTNGIVADKDTTLLSIIDNKIELVRQMNAFRVTHTGGPNELLDSDLIAREVSEKDAAVHKTGRSCRAVFFPILSLIAWLFRRIICHQR